MANSIHPTAIVGPSVVIGDGNVIGPYVVVEGAVRIGDGNHVGAHSVIYGECLIGDDNAISPHVAINTPGEIRGIYERGCRIGSRNVIREFTTIQGANTVVGDDSFFMDKTHIAHDCSVGNEVTIAPTSVLGGHVTLGDASTLGMGAIIHQRLTVGAGAMVGMNSAVHRDVPDWTTVLGSPARVIGWNRVGMERHGIPIPDAPPETPRPDQARRHEE